MGIVKIIVTIIVVLIVIAWAITTMGANIYLRRNKK